MQMIAYECFADYLDEMLRLGESTSMEFLYHSAAIVIDCFKDQFLCAPKNVETKLLLDRAERLGFPDMLGFINCYKWKWKHCPTAYHGQYKGKKGIPTVTRNAIAEDGLYFWHILFGIAECNDDVTVFNASIILAKMSAGMHSRQCEYKIKGQTRNKLPFL